MTGLEGLDPGIIILVIVAGLAAGWIDAVVGGGGLIQLPVMLMVPGVSPVQALATNKLGSIFGTTTSSITYLRRVKPDLRTALPMAAFALVGSMGGALLAVWLPASVFKPIIVVALIVVAVFTALKPSMGQVEALRFVGRRHHGTAAVIGLVIGFYDGLLGPGTGSFLVIALVSIMGYAFLQASAKAKIVNVATNLGALLMFAPNGAVLWGLGVMLGLANMLGGYIGARSAIAGGSKFIRIVFLAVVAVLIVKLGIDVWNENLPH